MFTRTKLSTSLLVAFGGALASTVVVAQQQLERVEITGSSIRRIEAEGALPVTVIRVEELTRQGVTTAEQAVQRIAANQSNSFGLTANVGGVNGGKAEADLRGLSGPTGTNANKTLVLLNNRRLANHSFDAAAVDLNAIPLAAVERIEVLRDSASTTYGTDAIGGVINFILRRDYKGLELSAERQLPREDGGGDTKRFSATAGWGDLQADRFNIMGTVDYREQSRLRSADRKFAETGVLKGDVVGGTSGTSFPGDLGGFEPSLPNCSPPSSIPAPDGDSCRYDFTRDVDAIPWNEQFTGLLRGSFAVTPEHTASLEYVYARNKSKQQIAPDPTSHYLPRSSPFWPVNAPDDVIEDIPDFNSSDPNATVPGALANWRTVPAGPRTSRDRTVTDRLLFEMKGVLADWDYKTGVGRTKNRSKAYVESGYTIDSLLQQGVFDGIINPFGPQTAAGRAAIDAANPSALTVVGENKVDFEDVTVSRELFSVPARPSSVAFGVEYRRERSEFENTDITAELLTYGVDPDGDTGGKRNVKAAFGELNIPLIARKLDMTLAARYDEYSDFGSTVNPKVSARYQPIRELLFRASAATGFRAPTLYEVYQPRSLTNTSDNYDDPVLCPGGVAVPGATEGVVCGAQVQQRTSGPAALGQPLDTLEPEESKTFTIGFVVEPVSSLTVGVDFWNIEVDNLISPLTEQAVFGDPLKYANRFVRCSQASAEDRAKISACRNQGFDPIAYIDTPTDNLGTLKTNGVDLNVSWRSGATAIGNFGVVLDGTYINKYKYQRERGGEFIDAAGKYSDSAPVFRWQHVVTGTWSLGPWGATLANRFKSHYDDQDPQYEVGSYTVWDGSVAWTGIKDLTLMAGVNNLFDKEPPQTVQLTTFQRGYDPRFTDALGRTLMFRASYKFF